jgi:hypothetical protein
MIHHLHLVLEPHGPHNTHTAFRQSLACVSLLYQHANTHLAKAVLVSTHNAQHTRLQHALANVQQHGLPQEATKPAVVKSLAISVAGLC